MYLKNCISATGKIFYASEELHLCHMRDTLSPKNCISTTGEILRRRRIEPLSHESYSMVPENCILQHESHYVFGELHLCHMAASLYLQSFATLPRGERDRGPCQNPRMLVELRGFWRTLNTLLHRDLYGFVLSVNSVRRSI
jgi:hypothetical protein